MSCHRTPPVLAVNGGARTLAAWRPSIDRVTAELRRAPPDSGNPARVCWSSIMSESKISTLFVCEAGGFRAATMDETIQAARGALAQKFRRGRSLSSPRLMREYLQFALSEREHEVFVVVLLDKRHRLLACLEMFRGTIDGASVHPREVVKEALKHNAAAVAFAHNHPSGVAEPSQADELITTRLKEALALVDIRVLDHIVIGGETFVSMAERGAI